MKILDRFKKYKGASIQGDMSTFIHVDEIMTASGVTFPEKDPIKYTKREQGTSGSCVSQTQSKLTEVWDFKNDNETTVYSATPVYQKRTNRPQLGMSMEDGLGLPIKLGTYLESDVVSQNVTDDFMDKYVVNTKHRQTAKPTEKVYIPVDFYKVAQYVQTYGAVMLFFKTGYLEWCKDVPKGLSDSEAVRHAVAAIDCISYQGVEYIIIEDSALQWLERANLPLHDGQRAITKEFFDKHCYAAGAFTKFEYKEIPVTTEMFTYPMDYTSTAPDVARLQKYLQGKGFFPIDQAITNYYGDITARAVYKWQVANKIAPLSELDNIFVMFKGRLIAKQGGRFGNKSITFANKNL